LEEFDISWSLENELFFLGSLAGDIGKQRTAERQQGVSLKASTQPDLPPSMPNVRRWKNGQFILSFNTDNGTLCRHQIAMATSSFSDLQPLRLLQPWPGILWSISLLFAVGSGDWRGC
jgi:hypothetical protein